MTDITSPTDSPIQNRYDFVYFFEITDGNPNGDPDAGNLPRIDPETGQGLVTDVCLKRKIRNFVTLAREGEPGFDIYVKERAVLNDQHAKAYEKAGIKPNKNLPADQAKARELTGFMCRNFFDIRMFGAVMTTEVNCGQVRGPVQLGMARSLHPIVTNDMSITRCAVTTQKEAEKQDGGNRTMGRKFTVPYALYRVHGYVNACLAGGEKGTGFSDCDLDLLRQSLDRMFELDRSAARGNMRPVACIAFKHDHRLGNARADQLFKRVHCQPVEGVQPLPQQTNGQSDPNARPPRSADDYRFTAPAPGPLADVPGVTVEHWIVWE